MIRSRFATAALILALLLAIGFVLSVPHTRDVPGQKAVGTREAAAPLQVTLRDSFKKGMHTLSGSVMAPNACSSVAAAVSLMGEASSSQAIAIALTIPEEVGVCLELPTPLAFSTTLVAPANLPITVTVNGGEASTTLQ